MTKFTVQILAPAEKDLRGIITWVSRNDSPAKALALLDKLEAAYKSLEALPHRGHILRELEEIGHRGFLEIHEGPYRVIYHITDQAVFIDAVLDGRRNMQELLGRRIFR